MEDCFYLLVGLPHQCLLLSQDPMESGHHESFFEDQLHAVTNKKEQKLMQQYPKVKNMKLEIKKVPCN